MWKLHDQIKASGKQPLQQCENLLIGECYRQEEWLKYVLLNLGKTLCPVKKSPSPTTTPPEILKALTCH